MSDNSKFENVDDLYQRAMDSRNTERKNIEIPNFQEKVLKVI